MYYLVNLDGSVMKAMKISISNNNIPRLVCVAFILLTPFEHLARIEKPLYILMLAILIPSLILKRTISRDSVSVLLFLAYSLICCIWSPAPNAFLGSVIRICVYLFLFLQLQFDYSNDDIRLIKRAFIVQGTILIFLCIVFGTYTYGRFWISSSTSGVDPNYLSEWFIFPLAFICEELVNNSHKLRTKLLLVLELVMIITIVLLTASRSGFVTNAAVVLLSLLFGLKTDIKRRPATALLIVIMIIFGIYFVSQNIPKTLLDRLTGTKNMGLREQVWKQLIVAMKGDWIKSFFGFGDNATPYYNNAGHIYGMGGLVAHNTFLDVIFNYGAIGFSFFIYMIIHGIKKCIKKEPYMVIGSLMMCISLFSLTALSTRPIVFMLFLLLCNIGCPEKKIDNE